MLTRKDVCTSKYLFIQVKTCLICSQVFSHQKRVTASVFMNKRDNFCVCSKLTILAALFGLLCEKPMIWFPWYIMAGFTWISSTRTLQYFSFPDSLLNTVTIVFRRSVTLPGVSKVPKQLFIVFRCRRFKYSLKAW